MTRCTSRIGFSKSKEGRSASPSTTDYTVISLKLGLYLIHLLCSLFQLCFVLLDIFCDVWKLELDVLWLKKMVTLQNFS